MKDFSFFGKNHIDPYDYGAFKKRLREVLADPADEAFLEAVAQTIRSDYSWEGSALKFYALLVPEGKNSNLAHS